jgi:hypothetical protein
MDSNWKPGPLPPDTYGWGGVVPVRHTGAGFYFADFCGDHVKTPDGGNIPAAEVAYFNNSLGLPPSK